MKRLSHKRNVSNCRIDRMNCYKQGVNDGTLVTYFIFLLLREPPGASIGYGAVLRQAI